MVQPRKCEQPFDDIHGIICYISIRALMVVMVARERSRDVSKQTVDAPRTVISSVATWAGDAHHDTRRF